MSERSITLKLGDFEVLESEERAQQHPRCKTCALPDDLLQQVEEARVKMPPTPWSTVERWLGNEGHPINQVTLRNHFTKGHQYD